MEILPDDRESPAYKLLIARLYNAGVKVEALRQAFCVDRKTMKKWGDALLEGDGEKLVAALSGRRGKVTREIEGFVRMRFVGIIGEHARDYSSFLRKEIADIFGVSLSGEALRVLLGELRSAAAENAAHHPQEKENKREDTCEADPGQLAAMAEEEEQTRGWEVAAEVACDADHRKQLPSFCDFEEDASRFCHHAGLLLFAPEVIALRESLTEPTNPLLPQWLGSLLLGVVNIEQSKFLDFDDLDLLLGATVRCLHPQRAGLAALGSEGAAEAILRFNARRCGASQGSDFYYDPHTKQYAGEANVLKGWCANRRTTDKAMHTDFIHSPEGTPLFMQWSDNFQDLRERFPVNIGRFRDIAAIEKEKVITVTVDRGIFGAGIFEKVIADPYLYIITWEKGYVPAPWPADLAVETFTLERSRNRALDIRSYRFEHIEGPWKKDPRMRQILVRATNPSGRTVEVSILSDDPRRPAWEVIRAIFWRWLQENDFKYLDKHFGINQITSYAKIGYEDLRDAVEDKLMKNGAHTALSRERSELKKELGRILVARRLRKKRKGKKRAGKKCQLAAGESKADAKEEMRMQAIEGRMQVVDELQEATAKEVSRLETLIEDGKEKLDTASKSVMDSLKIVARNTFFRALAPFKRAYDNYRDDHDYFRRLTQSHGLLVRRGEVIEVHLITPVHFPGKIRRIIETYLEEINKTQPRHPNGSGRVLRFTLGDKAGIRLASSQPPNQTFY
jgi:hypothetical protein